MLVDVLDRFILHSPRKLSRFSSVKSNAVTKLCQLFHLIFSYNNEEKCKKTIFIPIVGMVNG